jgi:ArsR family metal-binding transcriptional regulator
MFLKALALSQTLPCLAEPGKVIIVGKPDRPLTDVIPYLAALPGVIAYNPDTRTLTFRRQPGFMTLYPEKVFITQVQDADEGLLLLDALKDAINSTWDHRHELRPVNVAQHAPQHLDIYTLLPQTNCKRCGEATCLAFAVNLVLHKRQLEECIPLQSDTAFLDRRAALGAMLVYH